MKRYALTDIIKVYNPYDYELSAKPTDPRAIDLVFPPVYDDGTPAWTEIDFREIQNLHNRNSNLFAKGYLRFDESEEEDIFAALRIDFNKHKGNIYTREEIEEMILNPTDETITKILAITDKNVINMFLGQLVYLKNTNKYFIASKVEDYIRARKEELEAGIKQSELEGQETENISEKEVIVEVIKEVIVEKPKTKTANKTTEKKTTSKRTTK